MLQKRAFMRQNETSDESKKLTDAALSAVKDATAAVASVATGRGKIEITEVRDFAGENIEVKKFVDTESKEAAEKVKGVLGGPPSIVDAILNKSRRNKFSVLDKTKKDWGEFKEEKKLDEELDAYKKSSNQYLDKVFFLQRTDYREFERERGMLGWLCRQRGGQICARVHRHEIFLRCHWIEQLHLLQVDGRT